MEESSYRHYEQRVVAWAGSQPAVRAILIVGSSARRDHPADEWADLDCQVFCDNPDLVLSHGGRLEQLDPTWLILPFQRPGGEPERLVVFEGGDRVDFHFFPVEELRRMVETRTLEGVYLRGYRILVDKDGLAGLLPPCPFTLPPAEKPNEEGFLQLVNSFWFEAMCAARFIRRRELWVVKGWDNDLKDYLLTMLEWHAHARYGADYDTWHGGRFLEEWVDPEIRSTLPALFAHYDAAESWQALLATLDLFRRMAIETGQRLGFEYPAHLDEHMNGYIFKLYVQDRV